MMHGHLPTAARLAMWGGDKDGPLTCACGVTLERHDGKVVHLQHHTFACRRPEERASRKRWAAAVRSLTHSTVKHDRAGKVADAVAACWGADSDGNIYTAQAVEQRGWTPTEMTHHEETWCERRSCHRAFNCHRQAQRRCRRHHCRLALTLL